MVEQLHNAVLGLGRLRKSLKFELGEQLWELEGLNSSRHAMRTSDM